MKEKKYEHYEHIENSADKTESKFPRDAKTDDLEEIDLEDFQEGWISEETGGRSRKEDFPEEESHGRDWEDEDIAPMNPWMMAAAFAGLIVLAAIICALLWHFTPAELEDFKVGDRIEVMYTGPVMQSYPGQLTQILRIDLLEDGK